MEYGRGNLVFFSVIDVMEILTNRTIQKRSSK
jgi:hypothetical protein